MRDKGKKKMIPIPSSSSIERRENLKLMQGWFKHAQRMIIENAIAEAIHFFHPDALSSMVGMKVDFDIQITLMASSLYRLLSERLPDQLRNATAKTIFETVLNLRGNVVIEEHQVTVIIDKRTHNPFLKASGLAAKPTPLPWFGNKMPVIKFA